MNDPEFSNVTNIDGYLRYKRLLREADGWYGCGGAIEHFNLVTDEKNYLGSALTHDKKTVLIAETGKEQTPIYDKLTTFACLRKNDNEYEKAFEVTAIVYDEEFESREDNRETWNRIKSEKKFSNILKAQIWNSGPFIECLAVYLDKLYDLGFRLIRNDPQMDGVKIIHLNKNDIVLFVEIDYNVITSAIEYNDMVCDEDE